MVLILLLLSFTNVREGFTQPVKGAKELSIAGSIWVISYPGHHYEIYINIPARVGYYLTDGLEIEPEIVFTKALWGDVGFFLMGNLAYNFRALESVIPFVLLGVGCGSGVYSPYGACNSGGGITAIDLGGGVKYSIVNSTALRIEYRITEYPIIGELNYPIHNIFIGFSVFLR